MSSRQPELVTSSAYPAEQDRPSVAFRIVAWIVAIGVGLIAVFGLLDAVIMWLPDRVVLDLVDGLDASDLDYRVHFHHIGIIAWVIFPPLVIQLRHSVTRVAPMLQAWGTTIAYLVIMAASGDAAVPDFILPVATSVLVALHPARSHMTRRPHVDRLLVWLVIASTVPLLVRTLDGITEARNALPDATAGGESVEGLWANVAIVPLLIIITGLLGSSDFSNWQLPAWTSAGVAIDLGLHSIVFRNDPASVPLPWAGVTTIWGITFATAVVLRQRRASAEP